MDNVCSSIQNWTEGSSNKEDISKSNFDLDNCSLHSSNNEQ